MKKKLESELISIAHRILKLSGKEEVTLLHKEVAELYEKLTVLKFAQDNFEDEMPTIGSDSSFFEMLDVAFNNKVSDTIEVEDKVRAILGKKDIVWHGEHPEGKHPGNGWYTRTIGGTKLTKTLAGNV